MWPDQANNDSGIIYDPGVAPGGGYQDAITGISTLSSSILASLAANGVFGTAAQNRQLYGTPRPTTSVFSAYNPSTGMTTNYLPLVLLFGVGLVGIVLMKG